jgi:sensor domain CHASE-containing protein
MHWCLIVAAVIGVLVSGIVKIFKWRRTKPQQQRPSLEAAVSQLVELYHNGKQDHVLLVMDLATHLKANPKIDIAQLRTENWLKSH